MGYVANKEIPGYEYAVTWKTSGKKQEAWFSSQQERTNFIRTLKENGETNLGFKSRKKTT